MRKLIPVLSALFIGPLLAVERPAKQDYEKHAVRAEGDVTRGRTLFEGARGQCIVCHSVNGSNSTVGPDLVAAGDKYSRSDLVRSVLEPSANIMTGYATTVIATKGGEVFSGIIKSSSDTEIVLGGVGELRYEIAVADIEKQATSPASMMPEGLHTQFSKEEFVDLVAYMESLKQPQTKLANERGTPLDISALEKPVTLKPVFGETLDFEKPVWFGEHPAIDDTFVIVEKSRALVSILKRGKDGKEVQMPFVQILDEVYVAADEGLLGFAFHPKFADNGKYYFMHEIIDGARRGMRIGERVARDDLLADSGRPTRSVLEFDVATLFHHGGGLEFGPDGLLYIGMGDGGPQEDPHGHAQDLGSLSGKLMRIDVDRRDKGMAYAIPPDNPFVDDPDPRVRREIFAYGLRQPWRFSFDPKTADLWVGDVGQDRFEEVCIVRAGENHGWNVVEGFELFSTQYRKEGVEITAPVVSFRRKHGVSITGGYVFRSPPGAKSTFDGVYVCADYQSKKLWGITQRDRKLQTIRQIGVCPDRLVSFGRDRKGGFYAIGYDEGTVYKLDFSAARFE